MLNFDGAWRFRPPANGMPIPPAMQTEIFELIQRIATQGSYQSVLELFKGRFARASGISSSRSSSASWAETDLSCCMEQAAANAPMFIEAFYDTCESLRCQGLGVPDVDLMNEVLGRHSVSFRIEPPNLVVLQAGRMDVVINVPQSSPTLAEKAVVILEKSLQRSEELLSQGHDREAVQEMLWLLETVATAFRGVDTATGTVEGSYFNQIVRDLRQSAGRGTSLDQILDWLTRMHGYLSSPAGGGIRHGLDLNHGIAISHGEARLYCNLVRSYLAFLLNEHERMTTADASVVPR